MLILVTVAKELLNENQSLKVEMTIRGFLPLYIFVSCPDFLYIFLLLFSCEIFEN